MPVPLDAELFFSWPADSDGRAVLLREQRLERADALERPRLERGNEGGQFARVRQDRTHRLVHEQVDRLDRGERDQAALGVTKIRGAGDVDRGGVLGGAHAGAPWLAGGATRAAIVATGRMLRISRNRLTGTPTRA